MSTLWLARDRSGVSACKTKRRYVNGIFVSTQDGLFAFGLEYMDDAGFLPNLKVGQQIEVRIVAVSTLTRKTKKKGKTDFLEKFGKVGCTGCLDSDCPGIMTHEEGA